MSTSPFFAWAPFSKLISLTTPASSVETTAPCTALTDPTAVRCGAQFSSFTDALVTVVGGIVRGMAIIFPICRNLVPKIKTTIAMSRAIAMPIPRRRGFARAPDGTFEIGFKTSCISEFCLWFEQQAPQPARYLQLSLSPLRRGRLRRSQHIQHQHPPGDGKN